MLHCNSLLLLTKSLTKNNVHSNFNNDNDDYDNNCDDNLL